MKLLKISLLFFTTLIFIACGGSSSGGGSAAGEGETPTITTLTIADASSDEGENITFTVTSKQAIAEQITFTFEATLDNTTTASLSDFSGKLTGISTIDANNTTATISIATANDNLREHNETFLVILSKLTPTDATFGIDNIGRGTILANDATGIVAISVADATANENSGTINFTVTSAFPAVASSPFTFNYEIVIDDPTDDNSASFDDFTARQGAATIPANSDSTTISIRLKNDEIAEPDETFRLRLTNLSNATLDSLDMTNNYSATGTILNDDLGEISDATAIIGDEKITLNWTNPDSNLFAGVTIAQATNSPTAPPISCTAGVVATTDTQTISHTITGLTNGTPYSFRICARNNDSRSDGVALALENLIPDDDGIPNNIDVDDDNDGLIEIATATQFNNVRHNLIGSGYKTSGPPFTRGAIVSVLPGDSRGCPSPSGCNGYELVADIDLSGHSPWNPIGKLGGAFNEFTANFDGNNHTISGLRINSTSSRSSLFTLLNGVTVQNLKLANIAISGGGNVGALAGEVVNSTLSNIELIGDTNQTDSTPEITGSASVGGLVGFFNGGTIIDASSSLTIKGAGNNTGGLVGQFQAGSIKNSNSSGYVSNSGGADRVGGLVGQANIGTTISNSWASGTVSSTGTGSNTYGGLVGQNLGAISNSWASGNVSSNGNNNIVYGGLVGENIGLINNSWASGNVFASGGTGNNYYGGLVASHSAGRGGMNQNWASGNVTSGGDFVGGLIGQSIVNTINGRSYQLDDAQGTGVNLANGNGMGESFVLGGTVQGTTVTMGSTAAGLTALAELSGATNDVTSDYGTHSSWHAGFDGPGDATADLLTRFCDTDGSKTIEPDERTADNTVWVMPSEPTTDFPTGISDNVTTDTNEAGDEATYYQIPALRCIANTESTTDTAEIYRLRKIEIDRQRRLFPITR